LLFIGSGISIWAGLPNWRDLLLRLAADHDHELGGTLILDKAKSLLDSSPGNQIKYQEVGSLIEAAFKSHGPEKWRKALNAILNNNELMSKQSRIHDCISKAAWHRIITTNYDRLLEQAALRSQKHGDAIVTYPEKDDFTKSMLRDPSPSYILKIHGDLADNDSSIVLSKESFDELYQGALSSKYKQVIGTILRSSSVILFLGYSHDDPYARALFSAQMYQAVREKVFALVPREGRLGTFEDRIKKLSEELQIKFITYSPDNHHQELLDFLEYLAEGQPNSFDSRYREIAHIRKPTVVMLHCGGTIGSKPSEDSRDHDPLEVVTKNSRYDEGLNAFSKKLLRWYQASYNSGEQLQIDVLWEILPVESQMFSENASPELWDELRKKIESIIYKYFHGTAFQEPIPLSSDHPLGRLYMEEYKQYERVHKDGELTEKGFRSDFTNRYIMGIVVLFGTDTLAFAASALSLSLQDLPCSVVITGANQPPQEDNLAASRLQFYSTSDAWKNLMAAMYFLQCFGHRLTEVFVCFGDTIHNSTNLRKRATEIIPSGSNWLSRRYSEPFSFRNLSAKGQYMFKLIDGLFCNNYYHPSPPNPISYADLVGPEADSLKDLRHIRFDALVDVPQKQTVGDSFSSRVVYAEVSPCFPPMSVEEAWKDNIYAVLVEGYPSGTYPSHRRNRFSKFIEDLYAAGIPVVLISRYGTLASQQEYQVSDTSYGPIPVLPLFGIVVETALPLLSLVTAKISEAAWKGAGGLDPKQLIPYRIRLLREGIDSLLQNRHSILSLELKNIANRTNMNEELRDLRMFSNRRYENRSSQFKRRGKFPTSEQVHALLEAREKEYTDGFVVFSRRDLLLLLDEFLHLFEKVEAGPDGLEEVMTIGFEMGIPLWESFRREMAKVNKTPSEISTERLDLFFKQSSTFQQKRVEGANGILEKFSQLIDKAGITQTNTSEIKINNKQTNAKGDPLNTNSFKFTVRITRFQSTSQRAEKYAVMAFSNDERDFFTRLSQGCPPGIPVDTYSDELKELYEKLRRTTWMHSTTTLDWLLLGLFKGAACGVASFLRFDQMAWRGLTENQQLIQALRQRVKCGIDYIDEEILIVSYEYFELTVSKEEKDQGL